MRIFWLNGNLTIEPSGDEESDALNVLYESLASGLNIGFETRPTTGETESAMPSR